MVENLNSPWLFVIDTEDYAGNFERDLCAYITGRVGECEVGDDMAAIFTEEVGSAVEFENVTEETDDHGCHRPVTIYPTGNGKNNSVAILFEEKPTSEQMELMKKRTMVYDPISVKLSVFG